MKKLEYETANPGQDLDKEEKEYLSPHVDRVAPAVHFASNDALAHDRQEDSDSVTDHTETTNYYDANGATPSPNSRLAGMEVHSAVNGKVKGEFKEVGHSPAREALGIIVTESPNSYAAGPSTESGHQTT